MADCNFNLPCESTISSSDDALTITNDGDGAAIAANVTGDFATALKAESINGAGIVTRSNEGSGITATSVSGSGVRALNLGTTGYAVFASVNNLSGFNPASAGVFGDSQTSFGVVGSSTNSVGVVGNSTSDDGVVGMSETDVGVIGESTGQGFAPFGVVGSSVFGTGIGGFQIGSGGVGVRGVSTSNGTGVSGQSNSGTGVSGTTDRGIAVSGQSNGGLISIGVNGVAGNGLINIGIFGSSSGPDGGVSVGVYGRAIGANKIAGLFDGDVNMNGFLTKSGGGFKIDHPLDSANKYLSHSFVESSQMKNIYDGVVTLDDCGEASVQLPEWFETLNCDFCYQLTAIGDSNPNLYIAQEISGNCFKIAGGKSGAKVSWQLTGVRQDSWAQAHPLIVEEEKTEDTKGYYLHPELYNLASENNTFFRGNSELISTLEQQDLFRTEVEIDQTREQINYISEKMRRRR